MPVYIASLGKSGPAKIGWTMSNVQKRVSSLQTAHHNGRAKVMQGMTKQRFRELLRKTNTTQRQAACDLGISQSTICRWPEDHVPARYAAYALLMDRLTENERQQARQEMAA